MDLDHNWFNVSPNIYLAKGDEVNLLLVVMAEELSPVQLLVAGLVSGSGILALIVKYLLAAPERETSTYKQGMSDEHTHSVDEISGLKTRIKELEKEVVTLRNGMLRLAIATDLTAAQKREIANILGFTSTVQMLQVEDPIKPE